MDNTARCDKVKSCVLRIAGAGKGKPGSLPPSWICSKLQAYVLNTLPCT